MNVEKTPKLPRSVGHYHIPTENIYATAFGVKPEKISWIIRPGDGGVFEWGILKEGVFVDYGVCAHYPDAQKELVTAALIYKWGIDGDSGEFLL